MFKGEILEVIELAAHDGELVGNKWHEKEFEVFASDASGPGEGSCSVGAGNELLVLWRRGGHERRGLTVLGSQGMRMGRCRGGAVRDGKE